MKKLNNQGFTLIEMLLALVILTIFMVCVTAFVASSSKSTKQTKKQVKVQQDAQEVYDTIFDSVMQATALIINTKELASGDATASGSAVPAASGSATPSASSDARVRKSEQFDAKLAAGEEVYLFSPAAYDNIEYVKKNYEPDASGGAGAISDAKDKYMAEHPDITSSNPTGFSYTQNNKEVLDPEGNVVSSSSIKISEKKNVISMAQLWGAMAVFSLPNMEYAAFDDRE